MYSLILYQTGYKERALTLLISILEVNIVKYRNPRLSFEEILMNYEEYSKEENPKIGEIVSLNGFSDWYKFVKLQD